MSTPHLAERPQPDFYRAAAAFELTIPYVAHGRDPNVGLDCAGLVFALYRAAGLAIDDLDVPYGNRDHARGRASQLIAQGLDKRFKRVPKTTPREVADGDVLVIGKETSNHLAVALRGTAIEMVAPHAGPGRMTKGGMRVTKLNLLWEHVTSIHRNKRLC